jgi:hypothetical protein
MLAGMELNPTIVEVTPENLDQHPGVVCFINPKHPWQQDGLKCL